jgi:hypothetical protein
MDFRIADTFTDSLARLTGDEQKALRAAAINLQKNKDKHKPDNSYYDQLVMMADVNLY